jgi:N-glycosylase/DNA lyase
MQFSVALGSPFALDYTLESGQLFRWEKRGEWWCGVVSGGVLLVRQEGDVLRCVSSSDLLDSAFVARYFRLDEEFDHILASISKDEVIIRAIQRFYGLRLVRQERWECLASFVLATNANIPRIRKMVASICARYGEGFDFEGSDYHAFPTPEALATASEKELRLAGLGYRAPYLKRVSVSVSRGKVDFDRLSELGYDDSRRLLLAELSGAKLLPGVGPKVADCVLLYSLGKDEAFPIDVWLTKALAKSYPRLLGPSLRRKLARDENPKLSPGEYVDVSARVRAHFGHYAGYAQQYLFAAVREGF